ncbi:MAG TPA: hypothetical protein VJH65_01980 [Candidatus Nanoarchaeia archaeon]|nr:hypothetical protein [Candidatus Nanoarchaeia archaeon]
MAKEINKLGIVAVVVLGLALLNLGVTFNKISGLATDSGTANLTIESTVNVNFTTDNIDWGSGVVVTGQTFAVLDTKTGSVKNGNWTDNSAGLVLENIGNVNVSLDILAGKTNATFIGGTNPDYEWRFENSEAGSCLNSSGGTYAVPNDTFYDVNTTSGGTRVCGIFGFLNSADQLTIHFNVTVPYNAPTGAKGDIITATATAV